MVKKTATYKQERLIKILDKVAVASGALTLVVGIVRKIVITKNKISYMKIFNKTQLTAFLLIILMQLVFIPAPTARAYSNPAAVNLLTVANFAALAKSAITNPVAGTVLNNGDMGLDSPATCTGFPSPCTGTTTNGTINNGTIQYQNAVALQGQTDSTAAVTNLNGRTANQSIAGGVLDGLTLNQGVYDVPATATNLTGDLTLSGDADSVFIFRASSDFITASTSRVLLTGGAQACNVYWTVASQATFDGATQFVGTVFAGTSIDFTAGGATLAGRAIAQTAAITFRNTTVNNSTCASTSSSSTSSSSASNGGASTSGQVPRINITKVPNPLALPLGSGSVAYTYRVTNVGDLPMSKVTVNDNKCTPVLFISGDRNNDSILNLDEVWTYRCTTELSQTTINTATVHGFAEGVDVYDTARATVVVGSPSPSPLIPKLPNAGVGSDNQSSAPWKNMIIPAVILVVLFSLYVVQKKRAL